MVNNFNDLVMTNANGPIVPGMSIFKEANSNTARSDVNSMIEQLNSTKVKSLKEAAKKVEGGSMSRSGGEYRAKVNQFVDTQPTHQQKVWKWYFDSLISWGGNASLKSLLNIFGAYDRNGETKKVFDNELIPFSGITVLMS